MKNNNILLINPWIYDFAAYDFWMKPTGLLSISNFLEKNGYNTFLIDCLDRFSPLLPPQKNKKFGTGSFIRTKLEKPEILKHFPRYYCRYGLPVELFIRSLSDIAEPDVILVTSGMTYWYQGVQYAIQLLKEKFPLKPIVLGGIYATLCCDHAKHNSGADYVIKGPGEEKALQLVNSLTNNKNNLIRYSNPFPEPVYHHYKTLMSLPIFTSYGCPFHCSFCASNLLSGKFRQRNPDDVIDEIFRHYLKYQIKDFAFLDDALLINQKNHISVILDAIIEEKIQANFHTPNGIHPREITSELALKMFKSNFKTIRLSYETINASRQQEMGQKVTNDSFLSAIDYLKRAGYLRRNIDAYVLMGLPDQPIDEIVDSMLFVANSGVKIRLTSFSPIPGTQDWQRLVERKQMSHNIDPLLTNNSIYPLNRENFTIDDFQRIRNFSKYINNQLDKGVNHFDISDYTKSFNNY